MALDSEGVLARTNALPEQVESAAAGAASLDGLPAREDVEHVVVLGVGDGGFAGDVLHAVAGPFMAVPVVVAKGYECPSFVDDATLCFAIAPDDDEEVVEAASEAAAGGARMVVVAGGGRLAELAADWGAATLPVPAGAGALAVPALVVLERIGLFPGASGWIDEAVAQLRRRRDQLAAAGNVAGGLARAIGRTIPLVYGAGDLGLVAASRWKHAANLYAKVPAFCAGYPDLAHNELCGWGQHGDVTRQVLTLLQLRHDHEHPQLARQADLVREAVDEVVAGVHEVRAEGEGALAQLLDLVLLGDAVALQLAFDNEIDPGPVPVLDGVRRALAE
jgi:glucose/mannose-6-phosphate isomerase